MAPQPVLFGDSSRPMTYQEWLVSRGGVINSPQPQMPRQQAPKIDYSEFLSKGVEKGISGEDLPFLSGATGAGEAGSAGTMFSNGTVVAGEAIGTAPGGGTMMSTGVVVPASEGSAIGSTALPSTGGAFSLSGIGSAGNAILPVAGALGAYDLYKNRLKTGDKKRGALQGAASGAAMGSYFGPWGAVIGGGIGGLAGLTAHESTRDTAKRRTKELLKKSNDPEYQAFVSGMREQYNSAPPDPSKPFAGKYRTFDEYEKAGLEAGDLTGVQGNLKLGERYAKLTPEQRVAFTQRAIDEVGYRSNKGDVLSKDDAKLNAIFEDFLKNGSKVMIPRAPSGGGSANTRPATISPESLGIPKGMTLIPYSKTSGNTQPVVIPAATPAVPPRSKTLSPGIGLDGKPYYYGKK
jgi:hypothetical protein